ncbi:MAG: hypothetical protein HY000_17865 [Planctomycetes bacterium]|nr:hypothetical protein [Planctomycetota bacterium]
MWLNVGGSAGHSALWAVDIHEGAYDGMTPRRWDVTVMGADEARSEVKEEKQQAKKDDARTRLLLTLQQFPSGETREALKEAAGVSSSIAALAIGELVASREVVPCKIRKGNRKSPYDGFRLAETALTVAA